MAQSKFRFVSPGIQLREIDRSQIPDEPEAVGPVIIGRAQRGPALRPVKVQNFTEFVEIFGEPLPGGAGGDIWRNGSARNGTQLWCLCCSSLVSKWISFNLCSFIRTRTY